MYPYLIIFFLLLILPKKNINNFAFILLLIFLSIRYNIGYDFPEYYKVAVKHDMLGTSLFASLKDYVNGEGYLYYRIEFLNKILYQIIWFFKCPQLLIFLYSFLQIYFFKKGLEKKNINSRYPWILFFSFPIFMVSYMSIMRQCVAISIIFYNYNNIINKKYNKSYFFTFIACLFHTSAICSIILYFISNKKLKLKKLIILSISVFGFLLIFFKASSNFLSLGKYNNYLINNIQSGGGKVFYLMIFLLLVLLVFYKKIENKRKNNEIVLNIVVLGCFLYLNIHILGDLVTRVAVYFIFFILYLIDDILGMFKNRFIIKNIFIFFCFLLLGITLYSDNKYNNKLVPYKIYFREEKNE